MTKQQAVDEHGKVMKAAAIPSVKEIIDPFVYKLTGGAVRYDVTFHSTMSLGNNEPGCWRSAAQITLIPSTRDALDKGDVTWNDITEKDIAVDGKGQPKARGYALLFWQTLERLRGEGKLGWEENAFFFTHEQGIKAREAYQSDILTAKRKANRRSWVGDANGDPDKPGIGQFANVTWEQLEAGEVPDAARPMKSFEWFNSEEADMTLGEYMRQMYKKTTSTYVSKVMKREQLAKVMQELEVELAEFDASADKIATLVGYSAEECRSLLFGDAPQPTNGTIGSAPVKAEPMSLDDLDDPSPEELTEIANIEDEELVAGAETLEAAIDEESDDHSVTVARVFEDADKERIVISSEAISFRGTDQQEHVHYIVEFPESEIELFLEPGRYYEMRSWKPGEEKPDFECIYVEPIESSSE